MADIKVYLNNIKDAIFGKDVRGSIHDGIDAINNEVENTTNRQVVLENTFDQLIINAGNSNAENVAARVKSDGTTYETIGKRMDDVDSQLEHIEKKKITTLSLQEYDQYAAEGDYSLAFNKAMEDLPTNGGEIIIPVGSYDFRTDITLNKSVTISGNGFMSIINFYGSIITDNDTSHKLILKNLKLIENNDTDLLCINKTWTGEANSSFDIENVWFHHRGTGSLLAIYGARESNISKCRFTSSNKDGVIGIDFCGDDIGGAMNISVSQCIFSGLKIGLQSVGDNLIYLAGIRILNNIFIGVKYGVYVTNSDYIAIDYNMFDFNDYPIRITNVPNTKIRGNYIFSNLDNSNIIEVWNNTQNTERKWIDISHNHIFSGATTPGDGIVLIADNSTLGYGHICSNTMYSLSTGVRLQGNNNGKCMRFKIFDNIARNMNTFINIDSYCINNEIYNNFVESEVITFWINAHTSNIATNNNRHGYKYSNNRGKIVASGDSSTQVFKAPHSLISTPSWGIATKGSQNAIGMSMSYDSENVIFIFETPPPAGTNNVVINWEVQI